MKKIIPIMFLLMSIILLATAFAESDLMAQQILYINGGSEILPEDQLSKIVQAIRQITNDELSPLNDNRPYYKEKDNEGQTLNVKNYINYFILAYGESHGTYDKGHYRYLGYTAKGEDYTNSLFRPDYTGSIGIDLANWIYKPQKNDHVQNFVINIMHEKNKLVPNNFNYQPRYRQNIIMGFLLLAHRINPEYYRVDADNPEFREKDWENYVHILQPPSKYSRGTGRMFRLLEDGTIRYMDVPLLSFEDLKYDLSVNLKEESYRGVPGQQIESSAIFELNRECDLPKDAVLSIYMKTGGGETGIPFVPADPSQKVEDGRYVFQPGEKLEARFNFIVPDGQAEIVARIDRVDNRNWIEADQSNNEDFAPVSPAGYDVKIEISADKYSLSMLPAGGGDRSHINACIYRKDNIPGDLPVTATLYIGDSDPVSVPRSLAPGEACCIPFTFAGSSTCTIRGEVWPKAKDDAYPPDNAAGITVNVNQAAAPREDPWVHVEIVQ